MTKKRYKYLKSSLDKIEKDIVAESRSFKPAHDNATAQQIKARQDN